jgi:hypothetical protein
VTPPGPGRPASGLQAQGDDVIALGPRTESSIGSQQRSHQLRALITNGDFEDYWNFHAARERQRLYPGPDQRNYSLIA